MPDDDRPYIRVHNGITENAKIAEISDKAFRVLFEGWCYCSRNLTDGMIPRSVWNKMGTPKVRKELISVGMFIDQGAGKPVEAHDYLQHQPSATEIAESRAKKASAAMLGNHTRWHTGKNAGSREECPHCPDPLRPRPSQPRSHVRSHVRSQDEESGAGSGEISAEFLSNSSEISSAPEPPDDLPDEPPFDPYEDQGDVPSPAETVEYDAPVSVAPAIAPAVAETSDCDRYIDVNENEVLAGDVEDTPSPDVDACVPADREVAPLRWRTSGQRRDALSRAAKLNKSAHGIRAHRLVNEHAARCAVEPPEAVLRRLYPHVDDLCRSRGWTDELIAESLDVWAAKEVGASLFPDLANQVAQAKHKAAKAKPARRSAASDTIADLQSRKTPEGETDEPPPMLLLHGGNAS